MPKKKTIPPPDDFSSEFMETEFVKELSAVSYTHLRAHET